MHALSRGALSVWLPLVVGRVRARLAFLPSVTTEMVAPLYRVCSCVSRGGNRGFGDRVESVSGRGIMCIGRK